MNVSDGTLTKSSGCDGCPDAGAHSATRLTGDGYAEFVPGAGSRFLAGLGADLSAGTDSSTIDYAFGFWPGGTWEIRERGVYRTEGAMTTGDRFRVSVENGRVIYRRNDAILYASDAPPTYPLVLDTTFYSMNGTLTSATVVLTTDVPVTPPPPPPPPAPGPAVVTSAGPYQAVTDRFPHEKPAVPVLGPAGSTIVDPVFQSRMTRITDGSTRPDTVDGSYRTPSSSHQNAWSATGARFYVVDGGGSVLPYTFDLSTGVARRMQPTATGAGGLVLGFYVEPQFSYVRDSIIYGSRSGGSLRTVDQYDFATGVYSRLLDLDTLAPGLADTYVGGLKSAAGPIERVMAIFGGARQDLHRYLVVFDAQNPQNRVLLDTIASTVNGQAAGLTLNFSLHSANIDRSGRYVTLYPTAADQADPRRAPQSVLWDTQSNVFTEMTASALPYGHDAFGYGVAVNQDCCVATTWDAAQWQIRSLASPLAPRDLLPKVLTPKQVYLADHSTWNNARPDRLEPLVSGLYRYGLNTTAWRAWDDEIVALQTDAAPGVDPTVWRFAHHRSNVANDLNATVASFWYMPRPNVSPDGHWALFTSNWEKTLGTDPRGEAGSGARQDVFLVALTPAAAAPAPLPSPVAIVTTAVPAGRVADGYSAALLASGGAGSYIWTLDTGALPAGLALDATSGLISGTPQASGTFVFSVSASDVADAANRASASYSMGIAALPVAVPVAVPVAITTTSLALGRETNAYAGTVQASGGSGTVTWSVTGGTLPSGLALNTATGAISGTPSAAGSYSVTLTAMDGLNAANLASGAYTIGISAAVKITSPRTLPNAGRGQAYSYALQAANVQGAATWSLAGGALPGGITLDRTTGVISGIPLKGGRSSFNVRVKDSTTENTVTLTLMVK